jgi:hypothetical protein
MTDRLQKKYMVQRLVRRMGTDEQTAAAWLGAFINTLYDAFKRTMQQPEAGRGEPRSAGGKQQL